MGFEASIEILNGVKIFKFIFESKFTDEEFNKFLTILDRALTNKEKFVLYVDARKCSIVQAKSSVSLILWMKQRKNDVAGVLLGSTVIFSSGIVISLVKQAFKIQQPVSPNFLTKDPILGDKFLRDIIIKQS